MPRKKKTKNQIVSDIQLVQDAERRRILVRDILFPYLISLDENIAYAKVFIQSVAGIIESVYEEKRKKTTIGSISEELNQKMRSLFTISNEKEKKEFDRYVDFIEVLKDISVQDFAYAAELPRYIDGFLMKDAGKRPVKDIAIEEILGK